MVKASSAARLEKALKELHEEGGLEGGISLERVCERAGVSRATANRCPDFVAAYKRFKEQARTPAGRRAAAGAARRREAVGDLRESVEAFANLVQCLSLTVRKQTEEIQKQAREIAALRTAHVTTGAGNRVVLFGPAAGESGATRKRTAGKA